MFNKSLLKKLNDFMPYRIKKVEKVFRTIVGGNFFQSLLIDGKGVKYFSSRNIEAHVRLRTTKI
jgi:hypothetical protein